MSTDKELFDCRKAYAQALEDIADRDDRLVIVVNDSVGSSNLGGFAERFPERIINVGIAEQDQVGIAAGLENGGRIPVVSCAGSFLSARALEQVKIDAAYSQRHILLCAQSPGLAYGQLGATHHSPEDIAWMRAIPGMSVIVPADPIETAAAIHWAYEKNDGPTYIRISRMKVPAVNPPDYVFRPGKAAVVRSGNDVTIIANGVCVHRALGAANALEAEGISARVLSMSTIKPIDVEAIIDASRQTRGIITVEEGMTAGGLGGAVTEVVCEHAPCRVLRIGVPDVFAPTGSEAWLMDHFGMSAEEIAERARMLVSKDE